MKSNAREVCYKNLALNFYWTTHQLPSSKTLKLLKVTSKVAWHFLFDELSLKKQKIEMIDMNITLCGKKRIRKLNYDYRKKDKATDVLSFPLFDSLRAQKNASRRNFLPPMLSLGDIFICHDVTKSQASEFGINYEEEFIHLLIHGLLHLCGYDHEISPKEEKMMNDWEEKLLKRISGGLNGRSA